MMFYPEDMIREAMRSFPLTCPQCGSDQISLESEKDTDLGVMDEIYCMGCEKAFYFISTVATQFVPKLEDES
jgi:hypothetical protein